mmetsp:Transcript_70239/g.124080  ORF Transcript_70239/g.124080 Transcript_70239/m.124080 type:complete len:97 (+) Transcript_70239:64-354(+)
MYSHMHDFSHRPSSLLLWSQAVLFVFQSPAWRARVSLTASCFFIASRLFAQLTAGDAGAATSLTASQWQQCPQCGSKCTDFSAEGIAKTTQPDPKM